MKLTNQTIVISAISLAVGLGLGAVFGGGVTYAVLKPSSDKSTNVETARDNGTPENTSPRIDNTPKQVGKTYTRKEIKDLLHDKPGKVAIDLIGQPKRVIEGNKTVWVQYWVYDNVVISEVTGKFETLYIEVWESGRGACKNFYYSLSNLHI